MADRVSSWSRRCCCASFLCDKDGSFCLNPQTHRSKHHVVRGAAAKVHTNSPLSKATGCFILCQFCFYVCVPHGLVCSFLLFQFASNVISQLLSLLNFDLLPFEWRGEFKSIIKVTSWSLPTLVAFIYRLACRNTFTNR